MIVDWRTIRSSSINCSIDRSSAFEFLTMISWSCASGMVPSARAKMIAEIEQDVYAVLTLDGSTAARNHPGGTAPEQVRAAAASARARL